jgi:hypothetical protein
MRQEASGESLQREQALREARAELEHTRTARDDWEAEAMAQRVRTEEARTTLDATYRELAAVKEASEMRKQSARITCRPSSRIFKVVRFSNDFDCWNVTLIPSVTWREYYYHQ